MVMSGLAKGGRGDSLMRARIFHWLIFFYIVWSSFALADFFEFSNAKSYFRGRDEKIHYMSSSPFGPGFPFSGCGWWLMSMVDPRRNRGRDNPDYNLIVFTLLSTWGLGSFSCFTLVIAWIEQKTTWSLERFILLTVYLLTLKIRIPSNVCC